MRSLILALLFVGILAKACGAFRIWRQGLVRRFPMLFALLVVLAVQSSIGLWLNLVAPGSIFVCTSARRAAEILAIHIGLALAGAWALTMTLNALSSMTIVINGILFGVLCAVLLTRESDIYRPAPSDPQVPGAGADASLEKLWDGLRDCTRMLSQK
jgi:hypothetical protein